MSRSYSSMALHGELRLGMGVDWDVWEVGVGGWGGVGVDMPSMQVVLRSSTAGLLGLAPRRAGEHGRWPAVP